MAHQRSIVYQNLDSCQNIFQLCPNHRYPAAVEPRIHYGKFKLSSASENEVDGSFFIAGPRPTTAQCTMGLPCTVSIPGYGLEERNGLLLSAEPCGDISAEGSNWTGLTNPIASSAPGFDAYPFGTALAGPIGAHHLCWASAPTTAVDYRVTVDPAFSMRGPAFHSFACTLGSRCVVSLRGTGLALTNRLLISSAGCGAGALAVLDEGLHNPCAPTSAAGVSFDDYYFGTPRAVSAGSYDLCCRL